MMASTSTVSGEKGLAHAASALRTLANNFVTILDNLQLNAESAAVSFPTVHS